MSTPTVVPIPRSYRESYLSGVEWTHEAYDVHFNYLLAAPPVALHLCEPGRMDLATMLRFAHGSEAASRVALTRQATYKHQICRVEIFGNAFQKGLGYAEGVLFFDADKQPVLHVAGFRRAFIEKGTGLEAVSLLMQALGASEGIMSQSADDRTDLASQLRLAGTRRYHLVFSRETTHEVQASEGGVVPVAAYSGSIPIPPWQCWSID